MDILEKIDTLAQACSGALQAHLQFDRELKRAEEVCKTDEFHEYCMENEMRAPTLRQLDAGVKLNAYWRDVGNKDNYITVLELKEHLGQTHEIIERNPSLQDMKIDAQTYLAARIEKGEGDCIAFQLIGAARRSYELDECRKAPKQPVLIDKQST